ncbi:signal transduction histidine kinase [Nonomuraea fuscirosea]|uniref:histidine kinase n=1 Tax=Nonomuraea fuscirosea TaxID=1291556 RepID=A0A2T0MZ38_9ACTN|nr:histidine kinase [Nonomuraea fuscirosea]PRX64680.1 signal transduction histidine kinase [Nonomuraea fuscirosea]
MDGARPRPIDAVAALAAAGLTPVAGYSGTGLVLLLAGVLPVFWMRRAPLVVAWIGAGIAVAVPALSLLAPSVVPLPPPDTLLWPPLGPFAAYAAVAYARDSRPLCRRLPVLVLALGVLSLPDRFGLVARSEAVIALAVLYGLYVSVRERLRAELAERAQRIERERLAGQLHDVVTHRIGRIVLQAGAMALAAGDERARAAAEDIRTTGSETLEELRHMTALLRRGTGEGFDLGLPLPDLRPLVIESAQAGVPVELSVEGTPVPVPGPVGRSAYLVVEAALANVREHAPGADVRVRVRYPPGYVRIGVRNSAGRPGAWVSVAGPGPSLTDLRRRVEVAGGTLESGPLEDGGFHVEATFPAA